MAAAEEKKEGEGEGAEAPKPKSKKKLIIIIAAVLVLVLGGVGAALMLMGGEEKKPEGEEHKEEEVKHYATADLGAFIVNLSEQSSFLKVKILVEYDPDLMMVHGAAEGGGGHGGGGAGGGEKEEGGLPGAMSAREPMIKDAIIRVISAKSVKELLTPEGKDALKDELVEAINEALALDEGPVIAVYFIEFILQ